jgi:Domain of unknown function (DUF4826)
MKKSLDGPNEEEAWCSERRMQIAAHLKTERANDLEVGQWPAWHIAPIVSLWALNPTGASVREGAWAICGDVPTDVIANEAQKTPRAAVRAFAKRWHDAAARITSAEPSQKATQGKSERAYELALFLEVRARQLIDWTNDDSLWDVDDL